MIRPAARSDRAGADCARNRPGLLALLEDDAGTDLSSAARDHLDVCPMCRTEMEQVVLVGMAVRRTLAEARNAMPPEGTWPRLSSRVARRTHSVGRVASPVLGLALGAGLAVGLLIPLGPNGVGRFPLQEAGVSPAALRAADQRDAADEARQMRASVRAGKEKASDTNNRSVQIRLQYEADPVLEVRKPPSGPLIAVE